MFYILAIYKFTSHSGGDYHIYSNKLSRFHFSQNNHKTRIIYEHL